MLSCIQTHSTIKIRLPVLMTGWLDEAQTGVKIAGRNINNLSYADVTALMAGSKEELKSLLINVKEESEKSGFKTQHSKNQESSIKTSISALLTTPKPWTVWNTTN